MKPLLFFILTILIIPIFIDFSFADEEFVVASWNLKDFWGPPSYSNNEDISIEKIQNFSSILTGSNYDQFDKNFDIIFVQELKWDRDKESFDAFEILCNDYLNELNYNCASVTAGTFNGEGYGVIYRDGIEVKVNFTGDPSSVPNWKQQPVRKSDRVPEALARPPMMAKVSVDGGIFEFIVFNNHIKPSERISTISEDIQEEFREGFGSYIYGTTQEYVAYTEKELEIIFQKVNQSEFDTDNIIILGDLNADCAYLERDLESYDFVKNNWVVLNPEEKTTNFGKKECQYDRMIISKEMEDNFSKIGNPIGVYPPPENTQDFHFINSTKGLSDHKLIWAEFKMPENIEDSTPEIILTESEYENLGLYGTIAVVIGGIVYEIRIKRS